MKLIHLRPDEMIWVFWIRTKTKANYLLWLTTSDPDAPGGKRRLQFNPREFETMVYDESNGLPNPSVILGNGPIRACNASVLLNKYEMDPFPTKMVYGEKFTPEEGLPVFRIGPLKGCNHEKAIEQCCWLECTYYMFDEV